MTRIVNWNMRGLRANYGELELLIQTHQPVAFCLQELLILQSYQFPNKNYSLITTLPDLDSNNRPHGGTGILIRKDIPYSKININSTLQAVACRISIPDPVSLCSVYLPPNSTWSCTDLLSLVSQLPSPVLLMGDFNSHSTLWGCRSTNQKGLEIESFLMQGNLCLLNNTLPTYIHPATGSLSSLDLTFCDPSLYLNYTWSVHDELCGSDHYPTVLSRITNQPERDIKRWKINRADWDTFGTLCSSELVPQSTLLTYLLPSCSRLQPKQYLALAVNLTLKNDPGLMMSASQQLPVGKWHLNSSSPTQPKRVLRP